MPTTPTSPIPNTAATVSSLRAYIATLPDLPGLPKPGSKANKAELLGYITDHRQMLEAVSAALGPQDSQDEEESLRSRMWKRFSPAIAFFWKCLIFGLILFLFTSLIRNVTGLNGLAIFAFSMVLAATFVWWVEREKKHAEHHETTGSTDSTH